MSYYISEFLYESPIIQDLDVPPEGVNDQQDLSELDRWYGSPTNLGARRGAVERIRNRDPAEVAGNAGRVIAAIEHFYVETSGQSVEELHRKAGDFSLAFERDVFSRIVHCTANDLGDPVELRSPEGLATDAEQDAITLSASSGTRDSIVGNTRYVFASSASLLSQAYGGHSYRITDPDAGYVVPVDLADLSLTPQQADAASGSDGSSPDRGAR